MGIHTTAEKKTKDNPGGELPTRMEFYKSLSTNKQNFKRGARGAPADTNAGCHDHPWPYPSNTLTRGQSLTRGNSLESETAMLVFDANTSNILLRKKPWMTLLWESNTTGLNAEKLTLRQDGNLVITQEMTDKILWQSHTTNGTQLVVEDTCDLVLYSKAPVEAAVWKTNTPHCLVAHITMHSHDDVGWLLTPEEYSDGCNAPGGGTVSIFTTMMQAMGNDPERKFSEVEMYFFNRWWDLQDDSMKELTRKVVKNGQLQFINAGWSMHDEACVHQESAISNMEVGNQFLRNIFGETMNVTVGWHIDPFGHASTTPRLFSQMGFNGFFFQRQDYQQRQYFMDTKQVETMWNPSPSLGHSVNMFTSIMFQGYCFGCTNGEVGGGSFVMCPAPFYSFDCEGKTPASWGPPPLSEHFEGRGDGVNMPARGGATTPAPTHTIQELAMGYVEGIRKNYAAYFRTNHILVPWGCDFQHVNAHKSFQLMDAVLAEINSNESYGMTAFYSHPSEYLDAVESKNYAWPQNNHDFFLDSDNGESYWSGYLSSRAEYKGYERHMMAERVAAELELSSAPANLTVQLPRVDQLRQAMGIAQHHDSITGTERINVREQYQFLLSRAGSEADKTTSDVIQDATGTAAHHCVLANLSHCVATSELENKNVSAYIFNPLSRVRTEVLTIPIPNKHIKVVLMGADGQETILPSQVTPTWALTTTRDMPSPPVDSHPYQVDFQIILQPLALVEVVLTSCSQSQSGCSFYAEPQYLPPGESVVLEQMGAEYSINIDAKGMLSHIHNKVTNHGGKVAQQIAHYCPHNNKNGSQGSGAYIFRTCHADSQPIPYAANGATGVHTVFGPLCTEVRQYIDNTSNIHQAFKLCKGFDFVQVTSGIGEVDAGDTGREIILKWTTDINTGSRWYTDSEALEMQPRQTNSRPNYPYTVTEPVGSNYFPCNAFAFINSTTNPNEHFAIAGDRSRSTGSLHEGEIEMLVQRRLLFDDGRGVNQALNETTRVLTTSRVMFHNAELTTAMRLNSLLMTHPATIRYGAKASKPAPFPQFNPSLELPANIHLHTRSIQKDGLLMIRLQHLFAIDEPGAAHMATTEYVDLTQLMPSNSELLSFEEYDMNGVRPFKDVKRLEFMVCDKDTNQAYTVPQIPSSLVGGNVVKLGPMDIRTYMVKFKWSS